MIHLAYDGSINGDWVAWYALNLARHDAQKSLTVVHVDTGEHGNGTVSEKLDDFDRECERAGVTMHAVTVPCSGGSPGAVFGALQKAVPPGPDSLLVCGARLKPGGAGYIAGTVSEKLLSDKTFPVMAVRVVQPGLLGAPSRFLMTVSGDREGFLTGAMILGRFGEDVKRVNLLRVMMIKRQMFRRLDPEQAESLRNKGWDMIKGLEDELATRVGIDVWKIDVNVSVSDDWAHEAIIAAGRHKSHLMLMEASRHDLGAGYLYGSSIEVVLRDAPCDVAIYRGV